MTGSQDALFIGRRREQESFVAVLESMLRSEQGSGGGGTGRLVLVTGQGGIGKSRLLKQFESIAVGEMPLVGRFAKRFSKVLIDWGAAEHALAITDATGPDPADMMSVLVRQMRSTLNGRWSRITKRNAFEDFDKALQQVTRRRDGLPPLGGDPGERGRRLLSSLIGTVAPMTPLAPAGQFLEVALTEGYGAVAQALTGPEAARQVSGRVVCRDALAKGVRALADVRPLVVILDTCELLGDAADDLRTLIQQCGPRVCWVVGVRMESLDDASTDSAVHRYLEATGADQLVHLEMSGFDEADLADYLGRDGRVSSDGHHDLGRLLGLTMGIPLAVELATGMISQGVPLADLLSDVRPSQDAARLVRELAERYLRHVSSVKGLTKDLEYLFGLALLPDYVDDYGILAELWDVQNKDIQPLLRELSRRHDFVLSGRTAQPGAVMHNIVRETFRRSLLDADLRVMVKSANERAIGYVNHRLASYRVDGIERQLSNDDQDDHAHAWQRYVLALLWHTFWADTAHGVALMRHLYPAAAMLAPPFAKLQAAIAQRQLISPDLRARRLLEAIAGTDGQRLDSISLSEVLNDFERSPVAAGPYSDDVPNEVYLQLLRIAHSDQLDQDLGHWVMVLRELSGFVYARFNDNRVPITRTVGAIKTQAERLSAALANAGRYRDAIDAIGIITLWDQDDPSVHKHLALANAALGNASEAERQFKLAIRADPDEAELHAAFGELLILAGAGDEHGQRAALDWALRAAPHDHVQALVLRGLIPGPLPSAEAHAEMAHYLTRALWATDHGTPLHIAELRAIAHAALGETDTALAVFEAAIGMWTSGDKYRRALYTLLARHNPHGAARLTEAWQRVIARHPEAARPWGTNEPFRARC